MSHPTVVPMLAYADGPAALDWLANAFGFTETARWIGDDGLLSHGELEVPGGGTIMVATPSAAYRGPAAHAASCDEAAAWLDHPYVVDGVLVHVADVDAHFARAVAAGATPLCEPMDAPPGRLYRCADLEGHRWMFLQPNG